MDATEARKLIGKMIRANRLHRSYVEKITRDAGIHRSQHHILIYLMKAATPPSQKELAAAFEITPAAIAMSLKKMEQKGLIERITSPDDSRVNLIAISEKGREIMECNKLLMEKTDRAMIEGVTESEFETLDAVLDKFVSNLLMLGAEDETPPCFKK